MSDIAMARRPDRRQSLGVPMLLLVLTIAAIAAIFVMAV